MSATPVAPSAADPVKFKAKVTQADSPALLGMYDAALTATGLELVQRKQVRLSVPVGSAAELVDSTRVRVASPQGAVTMVILKQLGHPDKLARHLVEFMRRERAALSPADYDLPKWLVGLACLPLMLVLVGGLIGGLIGGLVAALNIAIARRESWPAALRAVAIVALSGVAIICFAVVVLLLNVFMNPSTPPAALAPVPPITVPAVPAISEPPSTAGPVNHGLDPLVFELGHRGVATIPALASEVRAIALGPDFNSVTVGHADGAITFYSLAASVDSSKAIARMAGPITRLQALNGNHFVVTTGETQWLVSTRGKQLRLPWRWAAVYGTDLIAAIDQGMFIRRGINSGEVDRLGDEVTELPQSVLITSLFGVELQDYPLPTTTHAVTFLGGTGPFVGFADGTIAVESLGNWVQSKPAETAVTAKRGVLTGFADGTVAGLEKVERCGSAAIVDFAEIGSLSFAIDGAGVVWRLDKTTAPRRLAAIDTIGPVRGMQSLSNATVVAGAKGISFYAPTTFAAWAGE